MLSTGMVKLSSQHSLATAASLVADVVIYRKTRTFRPYEPRGQQFSTNESKDVSVLSYRMIYSFMLRILELTR
jgi:hypothetical protein